MLDSTDGFKKSALDKSVEDRIARHCADFGIGALDAVKLFPVLARRQWLKRFLAHVELFKLTLDVPGDIAELGVFRGLGLFTWANLLESYAIGDRTKTVWGFDSWEPMGDFDASPYAEEVIAARAIFDADRFIPEKPRMQLWKGDIAIEVPEFIKAWPGVRFSLIHFDCDGYAPTKAALAALWPRLVPGGVAIFDEYAQPDWPGETQAVDEFLWAYPERLRTFAWTNVPGAYIVKGTE